VVEGFEHFAEHRLAAIEAVRGRRTEWPWRKRLTAWAEYP